MADQLEEARQIKGMYGEPFFSHKHFKMDYLKIYFVKDGIQLGDLNLAVTLETCVDGAEFVQVVQDPEQPSRLLFYLRGDKKKFEDFLDAWFGAKGKVIKAAFNEHAKQLMSYQHRVAFFKLMLDKARHKIVNLAP